MVPFVGLNGVVSDCAEHLVVVLVFEGPALAHQRVVEHVQAACVEAAGRDDFARHGHLEVGCVVLPVQRGRVQEASSHEVFAQFDFFADELGKRQHLNYNY